MVIFDDYVDVVEDVAVDVDDVDVGVGVDVGVDDVDVDEDDNHNNNLLVSMSSGQVKRSVVSHICCVNTCSSTNLQMVNVMQIVIYHVGEGVLLRPLATPPPLPP